MTEKSIRPPVISKYMHPRNPYRTPPSFKKLAINYPDFRTHCIYDVSGKIHLDFQNPEALIALTKSLMDQDFNLQVDIPNDRLVPTLPLRLNYLLWLEDLLMLVYPKLQESETITGCDIGTGASSVYPLLGAKRFKWNLVGTESNEESFLIALSNIKKNNLQDKVLIKKTDQLFEVIEDEEVCERFSQLKGVSFLKDATSESNSYLVDFTMCNPPFFGSQEEMDTNTKSKKSTRCAPSNAPTGSVHEMVVEGGEVAFISNMINMSVNYKDKIRIFSSLIGHQKNVKKIKQLIEAIEPKHYAVTEFCQGRTMRWGIAWTFDENIPLGRILSKKKMSETKPLVLCLPRSLISPYNIQSAWKRIQIWLKELKLKPRVVKKNKFFVSVTVKAYKETWLHQRKKNREMKRKNSDSDCLENHSLKAKESLVTEPKIQTTEVLENSTDKNQATNTESPNHNLSLCRADDSKNSYSECILKCSINIKQTKALIFLEMALLGGIKGKDAMNQLLQYMKNRLLKR